MKYQQIVFTEQSKAELQTFDSQDALPPQHIRLETEYTLISPGTELSWFSGVQKDVSGDAFSYPVYSGYCHSGTVVEVNGDDLLYENGQRVVTGATHSSQAVIDARRSGELQHGDLRLPAALVPKGVPPALVPFAKLGEIAMTAVRVADFSLGDRILVIGLGMVGNLAAQLLSLAGADVLAVDLSPVRLDRARACGIAHVVNPENVDLASYISDWSEGRGADVTVESVGDSKLILESIQYTRRLGEIILLGTPRRKREMNPSPALWRAHMKGIQLKGALRCLFYPVFPSGYSRYSVEDDLRQVLSLMARGRLKVEPFHTHTFSPADCQQAFETIQTDPEHAMGVVFDWTCLDDEN